MPLLLPLSYRPLTTHCIASPACATTGPRAPGRHGFRREPAPLWMWCVMRRALASRCGANAGRDANPLCECSVPPPAPKHPGAALEALGGVPSIGTSIAPDASGWRDALALFVCVSFANAGNKTPPGGEPEGVRVASGSRGDRPPACRRSADIDGFVAQSLRRRERAQPAARWLQCVVLGVVGDEVHGKVRTE